MGRRSDLIECGPHEIHLAGHLSWYNPEKKPWFELDLPAQTLTALLEQLGIPPGELAVVLVNGKLAEDMDGTVISEGDVVELYPPVAGG